MKKGSGSDPFADHGQDEESEDDESEAAESEPNASANTTGETVPETGTETDTDTDTDIDTNTELETSFNETATREAESNATDSQTVNSRQPTGPAQERGEQRTRSQTERSETSSPAEAEQQTSNAASPSPSSIVGDPPQAGDDDDGVPWVYVRDNVKQDREMVQFYLRDYLVDAEDDFVDAVSDELGADVSKTDVREAAYEAAMYNVDDVVDRLQAWGFESSD